MSKQAYSISMNQVGKEVMARGAEYLPLALYQRDIRDYIGEEIPPHWHGELEIFLLEEGSVRVSLLEGEFSLEAGDAYFVNSNVMHGLICQGDAACRYRSLVFDASIVAGAAGSVFEREYVSPFIAAATPFWVVKGIRGAFPETVDQFERIFSACESKTLGYEFRVRAALSQIFLTVMAETPMGTVRVISEQELRLKKMLSWLDEHYGENMTVADLAEVANISVRECQRYFSRFLQLSPSQYIMRHRLTSAADLLVTTDWTITEIGFACGFKSSSYFTKQFRARTGESPRTYRKRKTAEK